jgi:putative beta barrel porin BBP7
MRRTLFVGFGLALGVFSNSTLAADGRDGRHAPSTPPARVAKLGAPTALPDAEPVSRAAMPEPDEGVTPAGLRSRIFGTPVAGTPVQGVPGVPVIVPPSAGVIYGAPVTGSPLDPSLAGQVVPFVPMAQPAKPLPGGVPSVTESRNNAAAPGTGGTATLPSILPGQTYAVPGMESPLYCDTAPGTAAVGRVGGCTKWYVGGEYLLWWTRGTTLPPLLTTSSPQFFGIPGLGDTRVVLGGDSFGDTFHTGGRLTIGRWLGDGQCRGFEGRLFLLNQTNSSFVATSNEFPVLARPFFNVNTPVGPFSEVVADPARGFGGVAVNMEHSLWGAEVNYRRFLCGNPCARIDGLIGYRYVGLKDQLSITENFVSTGGNPTLVGGVPVAVGVLNDTFRTENHFHGGQIGLMGSMTRGRWTVDARATVAFGNLSQQAEISGGQTLGLANGAVLNFPGGLLALPGANIGSYTRNQFSVVPEAGFNVGYNLTSRLRVFVGYNFLYIGNVLRPEGLIDPGIDVARIPNFPAGATTPLAFPRPTPQFNLSDYFVQGISFGVSFRW